ADDPLNALMNLEVVAQHPVVVEQRRLLYEQEDRRVLLSQKYLVKHPRMVEIDEQLKAKRRHLAEAVAMATAGIDARVQELELQRAELQSQIDTAEEALSEYRTHLVELGSLQKEIATTEKILDSLREHLAEQQVLASLEANQATIIDPPTAGTEPVNIKKSLFAIAALLLGSVAAALTAVGAELLSRKVRSLDRAIEGTRMAVFGRMPASAKLLPLAQDPELESAERMGEAIRAIRARLRLATRDHEGARRITITSSCPGDGKSTVAAQLAMSLAAAGDRVLLIDGDLRKPRLADELNMPSDEGLSAVLRGASVTPEVFAAQKNLSFLAAGPCPANPSELLHAPPLQHLLDEIAPQVADWVIIDTPPLGRVSDALIIGEHCDYLLVVVREDHTLRADLRRCISQLAPLEDKVLGMIYNAQSRHSDAELYAGYGAGGYGSGFGSGGFSGTRRIQASGMRRSGSGPHTGV
nr:polysaccharide biosynthesis tyrosine autokinase [Planctomycetota bacterium]